MIILSLYIFLYLSSRLSTYRTHRDCHCIIHIFSHLDPFIIFSFIFLRLSSVILLCSSYSATVNLYSSSYPALQSFSTMCSISHIRNYLTEQITYLSLLATIYIYISVDSHSLRSLQKRLWTLHVPSNCKWETVNRSQMLICTKTFHITRIS